MHFKNGREARPGDKVVNVATGEAGVLYGLNAGAETCNARLAKINTNDSYVSLSDCLHIGDVAAADVPDSSKY